MVAIRPYREKPLRPLREITCERCGVKFLIRAQGRGRTKYCIECRVITYDDHKHRQKIRQNSDKNTVIR